MEDPCLDNSPIPPISIISHNNALDVALPIYITNTETTQVLNFSAVISLVLSLLSVLFESLNCEDDIFGLPIAVQEVLLFLSQFYIYVP